MKKLWKKVLISGILGMLIVGIAGGIPTKTEAVSNVVEAGISEWHCGTIRRVTKQGPQAGKASYCREQVGVTLTRSRAVDEEQTATIPVEATVNSVGNCNGSLHQNGICDGSCVNDGGAQTNGWANNVQGAGLCDGTGHYNNRCDGTCINWGQNQPNTTDQSNSNTEAGATATQGQGYGHGMNHGGGHRTGGHRR
ncbi:hypothetical protein [Enterococcus sp. LJL51]|uniref:hypothetical protein n=1 Tax=Enterococcus sp. LJL51 TaxID=3416656 RepID=UPI003CF3FBD7